MKLRIVSIVVSILTFMVISSCALIGGNRFDFVPMYGQPKTIRSASLKVADTAFIAKETKVHHSREKASKVWGLQGDELMNKDDLDKAMHRYNKSWLLNPDNYQAYWGFARVMFKRNEVNGAIKYLEKAETLLDDRYQKVALLSDLGFAYTSKGKQVPSFLKKADKKFKKSAKIDPNYPYTWHAWALLKYELGDYKGAWKKVKRARKLNASPFSPRFITDLEAKLKQK